LFGHATEHTRAYAVGSYVQAAGRSYAALEAGGGVEVRAPSWGIALFAEALGRMSPSADWTAAASFGLKLWDSNGGVKSGYTRASSPGLPSHAAGGEVMITISRNWVRQR